MTLREFECVECGFHFFIYDSLNTIKEKKREAEDLCCPDCLDEVRWVEDHNLTIQPPPKLDLVKAL